MNFISSAAHPIYTHAVRGISDIYGIFIGIIIRYFVQTRAHKDLIFHKWNNIRL